MPHLSRRSWFFSAGAALIWPCVAVGATQNSSSTVEDVRRLMIEVNALAERFHSAAVERTTFAEATVRRYALELAQDHSARAARLDPSSSHGTIGVDDWNAAMSEVAHAGGWRGEFTPFADDAQFLLASHILQTACADAFRLGATRGSDLAQVAGEAAYHAALVRTALAATASVRHATPVAEAVTQYFAGLRRHAPASDPERSAMRTLFLTSERATRGGFFPLGLTVGGSAHA